MSLILRAKPRMICQWESTYSSYDWMIPEMRHLLFVYVAHNFLKYNGLSHLRVFAQYESYTQPLLQAGAHADRTARVTEN